MTQHSSVTFRSGRDECAAWFYPAPSGNAPVVVLGIGLGSIKEMGLDRYAARFQETGYAALAFDYRYFGESGGQPRQLIDVPSQLDDWRAAIEFARTCPGVDPDRVVVWGTSFGGGHAVSIASEDRPGVVAAIAQCPFTDGLASAVRLHPLSSLRVGLRAARDLWRGRRGRPPVMVAVAGAPRSAALMTAHDAEDGFLELVPQESRPTFQNEAAARIGLKIMAYRPGRRARRITVPLLAGICLDDTVAPPSTARRQLARAPRATIATYKTGHFAVYHDPWFDRAVKDQLAFLATHVPA